MEQVLEEQKQQKIKRNSIYIFKIIAVISCSILSAFFEFRELNILFMIPIYSFCFFSGIDFFLFSSVGIVIGSIFAFNNNTHYAALAICIYFILFFLFKISKIRSILNHTFSATFAIFFTYLAYQIINHNMQYLDLAIVLTFGIITSSLFSFIIPTFPLRSIVYQNENSLIISSLLLSTYLSFLPSNSAVIICIRVLILIIALKASIQATLAMSAGLFLTFYVINLPLVSCLFVMVLPAIIVGFMKERKKWTSIILYAVSSIIFIFIIHSENYIHELIESGITTLVCCLFPPIILQPIHQKDLYYSMYLKNQQDMIAKLNEFSIMFDTLSQQFVKSKRSRILQQANIEVFDRLCSNCFKNQYCHQNGNHLLINYVRDGITNNLTENKVHYIKENCLKADAYLKLIDNFMNSYLLKKFENDDICVLKDVVSNQFLGFSKIMKSYKENLVQDRLIVAHDFYKNIKAQLEYFNYDVLYVNNFSTEDKFIFDIAIANCSIRQIKANVIPLINQILNTHMEIVDFHMSNLVSSYILLSIQESKKQHIDYFYKQNGKEHIKCGDAIQTIRYQDKFYLAISDGMGDGIEANEESQFTLEALFSTIKTGMNIEEGIAITNSLLKLKNQYDTYTTIDLIEINQTNLMAKFYKAGAFLTMIKRNNEIKIIENYALPIGIIDKTQIQPFEIQLQKNDIIVMMSDGVIDDYNDEIKEILAASNEISAAILTRELYDKFMAIRQVKDDATLAVIVIQ